MKTLILLGLSAAVLSAQTVAGGSAVITALAVAPNSSITFANGANGCNVPNGLVSTNIDPAILQVWYDTGTSYVQMPASNWSIVKASITTTTIPITFATSATSSGYCKLNIAGGVGTGQPGAQGNPGPAGAPGATTFAGLTDAPTNNALLAAALAAKQNTLTYTPFNPANNLSEIVNALTARTNLGLGNVDNTSDATKNVAAATLSNKTLITPTIASFLNAQHLHTSTASGGLLNPNNSFSTFLGVPLGGTGLTGGASGGVIYFPTTSTMASSPLLTLDAPLFGGGAGQPPKSGGKSGNTNTLVTTVGTQTAGRCVEIDSSGNHIAAASPCGTGTGGTGTGTIQEIRTAAGGYMTVTGGTGPITELVPDSTYWASRDNVRDGLDRKCVGTASSTTPSCTLAKALNALVDGMEILFIAGAPCSASTSLAVSNVAGVGLYEIDGVTPMACATGQAVKIVYDQANTRFRKLSSSFVSSIPIHTSGTVGRGNCQTVEFGGRVVGFTALVDETGFPARSMVMDILRSTYAGFPTVTSMIGAGNMITLSSANKSTGVPTSWTSAFVSKGDVICASITSATTTSASVSLAVARN